MAEENTEVENSEKVESVADEVETSLELLKESGIDAYVIGEIIEGEEKVIL